MTVSARGLFGFIASLLLLLFFVKTPVFAQSDFITPNNAPDVPANLNTFTQSVMIEVMSTLACQLTGQNPTSKYTKCLGVGQNGQIGFVENGGGAIGVVTNLVSMTFTPPASGVDYVRYLAGNFGLTKPAYAQGLGMNSLSPLRTMWIAFRDLAYLTFILVFIIIGMAIMLRLKIDPRTVMGIQNSIPRVIIGIILVTFSFAIAGFLIDIMWLLIYSMFGIFSSIPGSKLIDEKTMASLNTTSLGFFSRNLGIGHSAWGAAGSIGTVISNMFDNTAGKVFGAIILLPTLSSPVGIMSAVGALFSGHIGQLFSFITNPNQILGFFGQLLAFLIVAFAILFAMFKLWFILLQSYIMILIDIVFAPFWIIAGVIPGRSINFNGWLKDLGANLMAFPATFLMFLIGKTFMDVLGGSQSKGAVFMPPFIGDPGRPEQLAFLIGIAIVLTTPNIVNHTKQLLKAPKIDTSTALKSFQTASTVPGQVGSRTGKFVESGMFTPFGERRTRQTGGGPFNLGAALRGVLLRR
ncbi:hypothetical protein M1349_05550 [Patescibacteria group bacterium]|nr:hypothetical protein [Patescibacteria group bacterium]